LKARRRDWAPALGRVREPTHRADDHELLDWSGLAALDVTDGGDQLSMLLDLEVQWWRAVIRAAIGGKLDLSLVLPDGSRRTRPQHYVDINIMEP
jgi:hypothetical protein